MTKVEKIICDVFKIDFEKIEDSMTMEKVDKWDSMAHMELIASLEAELNIELTGDDIADMNSIGAIKTITARYYNG